MAKKKRKRTKLIQIQQKDLREWRYTQWLKQNKRCAACQKKIPFDKSVVDHKHKRKKDPAGVDDKGKIRGVLHFGVNALEGKIANAYIRNGLFRLAPLPEILRGIADYLENPPVDGCLHPSCVIKPKKKYLNKTDVKRVLKYWKQMYPNRKKPDIPDFTLKGKKRKTVTKQWATYIAESKELAKKGKSNGVRRPKKQRKKTVSKKGAYKGTKGYSKKKKSNRLRRR